MLLMTVQLVLLESIVLSLDFLQFQEIALQDLSVCQDLFIENLSILQTHLMLTMVLVILDTTALTPLAPNPVLQGLTTHSMVQLV
jgi:hypothetical protein